jgi:sensor histidine kinase YesM
MQISVMDNGGGFEASALEELQRQLKVPDPETQLDRYSRVGLLNVHYRIRMSFPDPACGIHLETLRSEEERLTGTGRALVRIVIPCTPFC